MGFFVGCLSWDFDFWVWLKLDSLICIKIKLGRFVANKYKRGLACEVIIPRAQESLNLEDSLLI